MKTVSILMIVGLLSMQFLVLLPPAVFATEPSPPAGRALT